MNERNNHDYLFAIRDISDILDVLDIPNSFTSCLDGYALRFPWSEGDIVCHSGIPGAENGIVESYRFSWDGDDVTRMTIREAVVYLILEYNNYEKSKN